MSHAKNENWKTTKTKRIEQSNEKIRTLREKEKYKYLEAETIEQEEMKEKKESLEKEKTNRNQTIQQKSHQSDKHQKWPPRKNLGTILKVNVERTSTNGPKNK